MISERVGRDVLTFRWLLTTSILVAVAGVFGFALLDVGAKGGIREWLMLLSVIQLAPFAIFLCTDRPNYLSFIFLQFFAGYTVTKWQWLSANSEVAYQFRPALRAVQELTLCTLVMGCVYYFTRFVLNSMFNRTSSSEVVFKPMILAPIPFLLFALLGSVGPLCGEWFPGSLQSLFRTAVYFSTILTLTASCPERPIFEPIAKVLLVWGGFLVFLYDASLGLFGLVIIYFFILACIYKKYQYFLLVLPLFVLLFVFQSVKSQYRYFISYSGETAVKMDHLTTLRKLLIYELSEANRGNFDREANDFLEGDIAEGEIQQDKVIDHWVSGYSRMSDDSLERVMDMTPSQVPYWGGETYYNTLLIMIPRVIWPDKPTRAFWNKFGRLYGYLLDDDHLTSIAVGYLAEGYMNFGMFGLYGIAIFMGLFIAAVEVLGYSVLNGYYSFSFTLLLLPLSNYANDFGTIINDIALVTAVLLLSRYRLIRLTQKDEYS